MTPRMPTAHSMGRGTTALTTFTARVATSTPGGPPCLQIWPRRSATANRRHSHGQGHGHVLPGDSNTHFAACSITCRPPAPPPAVHRLTLMCNDPNILSTVQRHREGPDANGVTHTERGPGPSKTAPRHRPPPRPERRPEPTRVGPETTSRDHTRPRTNPGTRQTQVKPQQKEPQVTRTSTLRRPDPANSAKKTRAHATSAASAPTQNDTFTGTIQPPGAGGLNLQHRAGGPGALWRSSGARAPARRREPVSLRPCRGCATRRRLVSASRSWP